MFLFLKLLKQSGARYTYTARSDPNTCMRTKRDPHEDTPCTLRPEHLHADQEGPAPRRHSLQSQTRTLACGPKGAFGSLGGQLEQAATVLYETADKLDIDDVSTPFKVFGVRASFAVVSTLITFLGIITSYMGAEVLEVVDNHYVGFAKWMETTATTNSTLSCG